MAPQILVGYITRAGYTREVATAIAQRLRDHDLETDVADLELCIRHASHYDATILLCATHFGHPAATMAAFITENRDALARQPTAYVSVDSSGDAMPHVDRFFRTTGWHPDRVLVIPGVRGAHLRRAIAWVQDRIESTSVMHVVAPTDWDRVRAFADELAASTRVACDPGARVAV